MCWDMSCGGEDRRQVSCYEGVPLDHSSQLIQSSELTIRGGEREIQFSNQCAFAFWKHDALV